MWSGGGYVLRDNTPTAKRIYALLEKEVWENPQNLALELEERNGVYVFEATPEGGKKTSYCYDSGASATVLPSGRTGRPEVAEWGFGRQAQP